MPDILKQTQIPVAANAPAGPADDASRVARSAAWWTQRTEGLDFASEDKVEAERFNRILWEGIMGERPCPTTRHGRDLTVKAEKP